MNGREVHLLQTKTSSNGHYVFLWLDTKKAEPQELEITASNNAGSAKTVFALHARSPAQGRYQGFNAADVIYLVMTDRFADGNPDNNQPGYAPNAPRGWRMKILMVLTSHDQLGNTGRKTGFWLEEFAAPYFVFRDAGIDLTLASPQGGQPPIDPKSDLPENQTPAMSRFKQDAAAQRALANTVKLASVKSEDYDTLFYPGGHGPMWDLAESPDSITLIESFYNSGKPIALVCHAPGVLRHVTYRGEPLVNGKHVTGFTNGEEEQVQLTKVVPFLVEDELLRLGAIYEKVRNWEPFAVTDGRLITGQNPASSTVAAEALLKLVVAEVAA